MLWGTLAEMAGSTYLGTDCHGIHCFNSQRCIFSTHNLEDSGWPKLSQHPNGSSGWPDSLQEVTPVITEPILQCRLFQQHSPAHLETSSHPSSPPPNPFLFIMSLLFHELKTKGSIRLAAEVLLLLPHNLFLTSIERLMLMKKEGSQILG